MSYEVLEWLIHLSALCHHDLLGRLSSIVCLSNPVFLDVSYLCLLTRRLGGAVGHLNVLLWQGTSGLIPAPGASWAAGHSTWMFHNGWITTGSGAMRDSVLSAWFKGRGEEWRFPGATLEPRDPCWKPSSRPRQAGVQAHILNINRLHKTCKWEIKAFLLLAEGPSRPLQEEAHRHTRVKVIGGYTRGSLALSLFLHSLNIY